MRFGALLLCGALAAGGVSLLLRPDAPEAPGRTTVRFIPAASPAQPPALSASGMDGASTSLPVAGDVAAAMAVVADPDATPEHFEAPDGYAFWEEDAGSGVWATLSPATDTE